METLLPSLVDRIQSVLLSSERHGTGKSRRQDPQPIIEEDLGRVHARAREALGYKRKDLQVDLSEKNAGRLTTPDFEYLVRVADEVWVREVSLPSLEAGSRLSGIFGEEMDTIVLRFKEPIDVAEVIDRAEGYPPEELKVDYDPQCRWCEISPAAVPATLRVENREIRVTPRPGTSPSLAQMLSLLEGVL